MNITKTSYARVVWSGGITLLVFPVLLALAVSHPVVAFDQPWNGNREDITGPGPPPPPPCPGGNCQCPNDSNTSSPVYTADGSLVWSEVDVFLPVTTRIELRRTYNSFDYRAGMFGRGWVTPQERNIARTFRAITEGNADGSPKKATDFESVPIWLASHGRRYVLEETATECKTPEVLYFTFQKEVDGTFRQVFEDSQSFSVYSAEGLLLQEYSDKDGAMVYYEYDDQSRLIRQIDSYGFALSFDYNDRGFVSWVEDQAGRSWTYTYDDSGLLVQVLDPDGNTKDYGYQSVDNIGYVQHLLTSVDDNISDPVLRVEWRSLAIGSGQGALQRVTSYTEADGRRHDYTYTPTSFNGASAIQVVKDTKQINTNVSIERRTFIADASNYQILNVVNNTENLTKNIQYNQRGNATEEIDERGNITRYEYNASGRETLITELADTDLQREISISYWNDTDRISSINEYGIRETQFVYDDELRTLVRKEIDMSSSQGRVWEYTYLPNSIDSSGNSLLGKVASMDGPLPGNEDLVSFEYNSQGLVIRIDYPLGLSVSYSYNAIGQRITETDMNGVVTEMAYDIRGRLVRSTRNGRSVSYKYSPKGLIEQLTDEAGRVTGFSYNEQKRVARIDYPAGEYLEMDYVYSQSETEVTESYYDPSGELIGRKIAREDPVSGAVVSAYLDNIGDQVYEDQYNGFDDITQSILYGQYGDAGASSYQYDYDRLGRPIQTVNGLNGVTEFVYDDMDRLTEVSDPSGGITGYVYNAWGDVTRLDSPDTGTATFTYDTAGSRSRKVDANNLATTYRHDAHNRLTGISYENSSLDVVLSYDEGSYGRGRLTSVIDGSGSTSIIYDDRGLIAATTSNIGGLIFNLDMQYDDFGQITGIDYPSGFSVRYDYDVFGNLSGIQNISGTSTSDVLANVEWAGAKVAGYEQGNGVVTEFSYDLSERVTKKRFGDSESLEFMYDNQSNVISQTATVNGFLSDSSYQYDLTGHLSRDNSFVDGVDWVYRYDTIGNRLEKQASDASQIFSYSYAPITNRVDLIDGVSIQYDSAGNILSDGVRDFVYNAAGRLRHVTDSSSGVVAQYSYNFLGYRVRKQLSGSINTDLYYVYGYNGDLLGEYDSAGNRVREYVYFSNGEKSELIAQIEANGSVTYLHTDHLSNPRLATNQNQDVVWTWISDSFGEAAANEDADGDGISVIVNHRFTGQVFDVESGLHYNHFRYYDPQTGRYITSDPIGLDGGLNTYTYAYQNPVRFSDPNGLAVPAVIGACAANPACAAAAAAAARAAAAAAARAAAAAAAAAACAAGLGPCGSDPCDCSRSRHRYLQNVVDNLCKPNPGSCRAGESCSSMTDKLAKHTGCANARRTINRECFRGGDRGHQIEYTTRRQQANTCNGLLATCCE